jgi:hypothetical protein
MLHGERYGNPLITSRFERFSKQVIKCKSYPTVSHLAPLARKVIIFVYLTYQFTDSVKAKYCEAFTSAPLNTFRFERLSNVKYELQKVIPNACI